MAKKTTTESGAEPTGKEIRIPADGAIKVFNSAFNEAHELIDDANEGLKDASDSAKKKHLFLPAFKTVKSLYDKFGDGDGKNAEKLATWLSHFDHYRKYFKLDELANLQGRLKGVGEIGGEPEADSDGDETKGDDGEDLRPRHLRQPNASVASAPSATDAVRDMAAKAGAKTQPEGPIDKVGRGDPKLN